MCEGPWILLLSFNGYPQCVSVRKISWAHICRIYRRSPSGCWGFQVVRITGGRLALVEEEQILDDGVALDALNLTCLSLWLHFILETIMSFKRNIFGKMETNHIKSLYILQFCLALQLHRPQTPIYASKVAWEANAERGRKLCGKVGQET